MKDGPVESRRKRILLFYTLAMLIPGLILGYLAYRGILNDQALREKQSRQNLEGTSQEFFIKIDSLLTTQFDAWLNPGIPEQSDQNLLILFQQSPDQKKSILKHKLLYLPESYALEMHQPDPISINWEEGWTLEFQEKDLNGAFVYYKRTSENTEITQLKLRAKIAMARISLKQKLPDEALKIYQEINQSYNQLLLNGKIPAGALALLEMARIYQLHNDVENLTLITQQLYDFLLAPPASYEKFQFSLFSNSIADLAESIHNNKDIDQTNIDIIDSLQQTLSKRIAQTDQLIRIFDEPDLLNSIGFKQTNSSREYLSREGLKGLFLTQLDSEGLKTFLVLDIFPYLNNRMEQLFDSLDPEKKLSWQIIDENQTTLWSNNTDEKDSWSTFSFPDNPFPWKLLLQQNKIGWPASMLQSGNGIFILIFVFITLIMVLGLGFTLYTLNQELRLNKLKTEFISNVSHELKSPLTSIRQMTEMLNDRRVDTEEQRFDYYGIMLDQSEHLSHLIDNILDFSRMEEGRKHYHFEKLDLVPLVEKMVNNFEHQQAERGFTFVFSSNIGKALVNADKQAIRQVFYNLLDNAHKYSGGSKIVEVELKAQGSGLRAQEGFKNEGTGIKDGMVVISIRDWGVGISKKDQDKIFDRFFRSNESQLLGIKGSGIGLTLVKRIVEAHQGRVEVESKQGEGSTFYVFIPILKENVNEKNTAG